MLKRSNKKRHIHQDCEKNTDSSLKEGLGYIETGIQSALGEKQRDDGDDRLLEQVVLGGDTDILDQFDQKAKKEKKTAQPLEGPAAVWEDEEDSNIRVQISSKTAKNKQFKHNEGQVLTGETYTKRLKQQFEKTTGQPNWAKLKWQKSDDEEESDEDQDATALLQGTGNYLGTSESLQEGNIQIKSCTDANAEQPLKSKVKAMEFHPTSQVMLTGGSSQTLALFQVDGKHNPKIQSIFLEKFPIVCAHFSRDGTEVIMGSIHRRFKYYDMLSGHMVDVPPIKGLEENKMGKFVMSPDGKYIAFLGQYGRIHLVSAKSKEWIHTLKMNGSVEAIAFSPEGSQMFSHGDDGEVYVWDMSTRDCVHRFTDEGCIKGTALAVSNNGRFIAAGSYSGVVNIYDNSCLTSKTPTPLKAMMNLTTPCTRVMFNSTDEILAAASNYAANAVKLIHVSSLTAFANYPTKTSNIHMPYAIDFSTNSGYFAIGNNSGQALLYRLKHYSNY